MLFMMWQISFDPNNKEISAKRGHFNGRLAQVRNSLLNNNLY